ncbi:glycosyl hydrolase family 92-domain-containing protein [Mycena leptocephala]|nr:glycosyl hydrolase family 92-domain-containing protein [Mycena leptocephala]
MSMRILDRNWNAHGFVYEWEPPFYKPEGPPTDQMIVLLDVTGDLGKSFHGGKVAFTPSLTAAGTMRVTGSPRISASMPSLTLGEGRTNAGVIMGFGSGTGMEKGKEGEVKDAPTVAVRVGISWTSTHKACRYAEEEVPDMVAFDEVHDAARAQWNAVLFTVNATSVSAATQELFWTSMYRTYIAPTNITGDNSLLDSGEPSWDSYIVFGPLRRLYPNPPAETHDRQKGGVAGATEDHQEKRTSSYKAVVLEAARLRCESLLDVENHQHVRKSVCSEFRIPVVTATISAMDFDVSSAAILCWAMTELNTTPSIGGISQQHFRTSGTPFNCHLAASPGVDPEQWNTLLGTHWENDGLQKIQGLAT